MNPEGCISWIAKLCCGVDTFCTEAKDMLPQEPMEHVRDQFLTAGESLKQFYFDLKKDVSPIFTCDSPQANGPTSTEKKENTGLPPDNKSTISCDDGQEGISEAVKSLSCAIDDAPGDEEVHISFVTKKEGETGMGRTIFEELLSEEFKSDTISILNSLFKGLTPEEIQNVARAQLAAPVKSLVVGSYDDIDYNSDSEFSTKIQEYKVPDAHAKLSAPYQSLVVGSYEDLDGSSKILDSKFSTEIQEYEVSDDESCGAIHSVHKDSHLLGWELRAELIRLGFLGPDSGPVQSLEVDSSEETEESDNSTESESSTEEEYTSTDDEEDYTSTDDEVTSSVSTISTKTSSNDSTMFDYKLRGLFSDSDSDSDISEYSSSEDTSDSDTGDAQPIEEQKLDDSIILVNVDSHETDDEPPLLDMKFVEAHSCGTASQGSLNAESNQGKAEVSDEKEWERLDDDFSDSDWEIV